MVLPGPPPMLARQDLGGQVVIVEVACRDEVVTVRLDVEEVPLPRRGGRRHYGRCPACERRVLRLYATRDMETPLACRCCEGLVYASTRLSPARRRARRAHAIRRLLGGSENILIPFPERPMRMHRRRYERLRRVGLEAEKAYLEATGRHHEALKEWAGSCGLERPAETKTSKPHGDSFKGSETPVQGDGRRTPCETNDGDQEVFVELKAGRSDGDNDEESAADSAPANGSL